MNQRRIDLAVMEAADLRWLLSRLEGVLRVARENEGSKEEAESAQMHIADIRAELEIRKAEDEIPF
jgi:hypothetical protein